MAGILTDYRREGGRGRIVALGLASIDASDGAARLRAERPGLEVRTGPDDQLLGARVIDALLPGGPTLRLLEPSTEGRLAAFLARHGEGQVALYVEEDGQAPPLLEPRIVSRAGRWGPYLIAVAASRGRATAGTIAAMPDADVDLRPARSTDAERIAALFTDEGYPCGPSDILERLARFDSPYSAVRVAETGGEVVGFVAVHILPRFEHSDRIGRVLALVVDAGARERGLGHQLMGEAERIARGAGCAFVEVTAGHHRLDAQSLYGSLGYEAGVTSYLRKRL